MIGPTMSAPHYTSGSLTLADSFRVHALLIATITVQSHRADSTALTARLVEVLR